MVLALISMDLSNNIMDLSNKTLDFSNNTKDFSNNIMDFPNKTMDLFNIAMDFSNNLTNQMASIKSSPLKNSGGFIPIQNPFKTKNKNLFKKKKKTKITTTTQVPPKDPWKESGKTYYSQQQNTVSAKSPSLLDNVSH